MGQTTKLDHHHDGVGSSPRGPLGPGIMLQRPALGTIDKYFRCLLVTPAFAFASVAGQPDHQAKQSEKSAFASPLPSSGCTYVTPQ
jgi:hypothetical protein